VGFSLFKTPKYKSSIELLVGQGNAITKSPADVLGLQQATPTVAETICNRSVAEDVIGRHNLRMSPQKLVDNLSVQQIPSTQLIRVSHRSTDPKTAQRLANTIGEVSPQRLSELQNGGAAITALMVQDAPLPQDPVSPNIARNTALALVLGLLLGTALALLLEFRSDRAPANPRPDEGQRVDREGQRARQQGTVGSLKTATTPRGWPLSLGIRI